jgi:hypothetical protein
VSQALLFIFLTFTELRNLSFEMSYALVVDPYGIIRIERLGQAKENKSGQYRWGVQEEQDV